MTPAHRRSPICRPHVQLGDDELRIVLDFAADDVINHKFAVSQVSSQWRAVSTSMSPFWSSFTVRTLSDSSRLPTVIANAGSALLDVSLDFTLRKRKSLSSKHRPVFSEFDRSRVYGTLGPHAERLRRLVLDLGELDHPHVWCSESLAPLFVHPCTNLEELSLAWRPAEWIPKGPNRFIRCITEAIVVPLHPTPRLRNLHLENVVPAVWRAIAAPTLEIFDVRSTIHDPFLLSGILHRCPLVSSLTLIAKGPLSTTFSNTGAPPASVVALRSVHVSAPFLNIWTILGASVDTAAIHDITVTITGDEHAVTTGLVYDKLLQRFGPIFECSLTRSDPDADQTRPGYDVYNVVDSSGRLRRVIVSCSQNQFIAAFWGAVLMCPRGTNELRRLTTSHFLWFSTSFFLTLHNARLPISELRIILPDSATGLADLKNVFLS